jgi:hypothetical protein
MGRQCRALNVTLRVSADLEAPSDGDDEATWLLGHTQRITFRRLWRHREDLFARVTLHVPCKYLSENGSGACCDAWGYRGQVAPSEARHQARQFPNDEFRIVENGRVTTRQLRQPAPTKRQLAVLNVNPCATARCRTSDNTIGAACCRDLQIEIMCDERWTRQDLLVRSRQSPYLCKVERERPDSLEVEVISACGYLGPDGVACTLHGRRRPDGSVAKPALCRRWPKPTKDETLHPGCVYQKSVEGGRRVSKEVGAG